MSLAGSYNGLAFGPGTKVHVGAIAGLDDIPGIRAADAPRAGDHGSWAGRDFMDGRAVDMTFNVVGDDFNDYAALIATVETALAPIPPDQAAPDLLLYGSTRLVKAARVRRGSFPYDATTLARTGSMLAQFYSTDPRVYDATLQTTTVGLPTASGGMTFDAAFNLGFGSAGTGGQVQVTNAGNFATRPVLSIVGPCDTPIIQNVTQGKTLQFNITLATGDTLAIDTDTKSILLTVAGSSIPASRRATLAGGSQWFDLAPGASTITFRANTYQAAAQLSIQFRSAWLGRGGAL